MAKDDPVNWETEPIENFLNEHFLYRGIHRIFWINWRDINKIEPNLFAVPKPGEEGLSTDWSKYSAPQDTLNRLRIPDLKINGIIALNVGQLRNIIKIKKLPLNIMHDPIRISTEFQQVNRAHTLIIGMNKQNKAKIKRNLAKIANWVEGYKPIHY